MAQNLPVRLNYAQTQELKRRVFEVASSYAQEQGLHLPYVELEMAFICGHYAASQGVMNAEYREWIDAKRATNGDHEVGAHDGQPDGGGGDQAPDEPRQRGTRGVL